MMRPNDEELTPAERDAISRLSREADPPPSLERRTVVALQARGLLRPPRRRFGALLGLAASVLLVAGGWALGRFGSGEEPSDQPRFMLLLYEGPEYRQPAPGRMEERVQEYVDWVGAARTDGVVEGGEKLRDGDDVAVRPDGSAGTVPAAPGGSKLAGYFLVRAADQRTAMAIARTCPHLRHGGSIVLREIDPT